MTANLAPQQVAVQASHAALEAGSLYGAQLSSHLILLTIKDEVSLKEFHQELKEQGIQSVLFFEPDYNPPQFTALCTELISEEQGKLFKKLKLYKPTNDK